MKGILFTSFVEFAELNFGFDFVDKMLDRVDLSTGGAYTNVGSYPAQELLDMVAYIVSCTNSDEKAMQLEFGSFTFGKLVARYPKLVENYQNSFECICEVDQTIHRMVRRLYPEAELPELFAKLDETGNRLSLDYSSSRPLLNVAHGLLRGCVDYYGDDVDIEMTELSEGQCRAGNFILTRNE